MASEGTPDWETNPDIWDILKLNGKVLPGPWNVTDGNGKRVIDVKKAPGLDGARIKDEGYEPGAITFEGQFLARDWKAYEAIVADLRPTLRKSKNKNGQLDGDIEAEHPKLRLLGITRVYLTEIEFPDISPDKIMTARIHATEWTAPKAIGKKKKPDVATAMETDPVLLRVRGPDDKVNYVDSFLADQNVSNAHNANAYFQDQQKSGYVPNFGDQSPAYIRTPGT
jgi:hypothetical protein